MLKNLNLLFTVFIMSFSLFYSTLIFYKSLSSSATILAISRIVSSTSNSHTATSRITPCCHNMAVAIIPDAC